MNGTQDNKSMWQRMALRLVLMICAITAVVIWIPFLWKILGPFLIGLVIAAALQPVVGLAQRLHIKRGISSLILVLVVFALIGLLTYWFLSFVVTQAINALQNAPQWIEGINEVYSGFRQRIEIGRAHV